MQEKTISLVLRDILVLVGGTAIVAGFWMAWHPLGLVVGGLTLGFLGIAGQIEADRRRADTERNRRLGV
jgi:hypothetical protein